jgi:hypothetical protein
MIFGRASVTPLRLTTAAVAAMMVMVMVVAVVVGVEAAPLYLTNQPHTIRQHAKRR